MTRATLTLLLPLLLPLASHSQLPPPPTDLSDFPPSFGAGAPGALAADKLLDKPAGRLGPVVVKGDHFYTGDRRIRFWGVNLAFSACFPTHDQADRLALRLSRFGINAVRLHHMSMFKFPNGIFADDALESLSDQSLDRLDYLISALKKQGIYSDLNLHVSRTWSKAHRLPNADKLPESMDKTVNLFLPDIIQADKRYARDLLTHVNKYTAQPYTAEPAVCMVDQVTAHRPVYARADLESKSHVRLARG
jgi:hypothetical protein